MLSVRSPDYSWWYALTSLSERFTLAAHSIHPLGIWFFLVFVSLVIVDKQSFVFANFFCRNGDKAAALFIRIWLAKITAVRLLPSKNSCFFFTYSNASIALSKGSLSDSAVMLLTMPPLTSVSISEYVVATPSFQRTKNMDYIHPSKVDSSPFPFPR